MPRRLVHRDHYARARWALFIEDPGAETADRKSSTRTMAGRHVPQQNETIRIVLAPPMRETAGENGGR